MKHIDEMLEELHLHNQIELEDVPKVDLYMDQVIQLFETSFGSSKRTEDEKVMTKTMINNYAKGKLFFPIRNKKYSREHLMLISLIYQMKGALSITDIKDTLRAVNEKVVEEKFPLHLLYERYLGLAYQHVNHFEQDVRERASEIQEEAEGMESLEHVLLIASFANISNMYRRMAEKLIDEWKETYDGKK